jgi:hypothetical protein
MSPPSKQKRMKDLAERDQKEKKDINNFDDEDEDEHYHIRFLHLHLYL